MISVLEAIKLSSGFLEKKGIESPRLNAEIMLSHILKCRRLNLYLAFDQPLKEDEITVLREFLKRRGNREPLQYIIGEVEFFGLPFSLNPSVLIPRQETEILVETVIDYCRNKQIRKILDIGTGSGNIAISLAVNLPDVEVTAIDLSVEALETAKLNALNNNVGERVRCRLINILNEEDQLPGDFDIIVSNPPYIARTEFEKLAPELRVYEPTSALTDFADGLTFYRRIISTSCKWLKPEGALFLEAGEGQAQDIKEEMEISAYKNIKFTKDYLNINRVVSGELN
jgi:release factor glutamine methyltransferase